MNLESKFPKTIFSEQYIEKYGLKKAFLKQLTVVAGEILETQEAWTEQDYEHTIEECVDVMQSIYTALYMIPGYTAKKVENIIKQVQDKNTKRGYYETFEKQQFERFIEGNNDKEKI